MISNSERDRITRKKNEEMQIELRLRKAVAL